jgi:hypothetical protein
VASARDSAIKHLGDHLMECQRLPGLPRRGKDRRVQLRAHICDRSLVRRAIGGTPIAGCGSFPLHIGGTQQLGCMGRRMLLDSYGRKPIKVQRNRLPQPEIMRELRTFTKLYCSIGQIVLVQQHAAKVVEQPDDMLAIIDCAGECERFGEQLQRSGIRATILGYLT